MRYPKITNWDDAYENPAHIPNAEKIRNTWPKLAKNFRKQMVKKSRAQLDIRYSKKPRNLMDVFLPEKKPKGLVVFIHGGYWRVFSKDVFSHLAKGALDKGYAVAMPSYTLCPDIKVSGITKEVGTAINHAAKLIKGDIYIVGHSAGGHLASRMICKNTPLKSNVQKRIQNTMSISGVSDMRPLLGVNINDDVRLTAKEASAESPALLTPMKNAKLTCWVGMSELSEFIRQNALLANIWHGLGADITLIEEQNTNHFTVIEGLVDSESDMVRQLLG